MDLQTDNGLCQNRHRLCITRPIYVFTIVVSEFTGRMLEVTTRCHDIGPCLRPFGNFVAPSDLGSVAMHIAENVVCIQGFVAI